MTNTVTSSGLTAYWPFLLVGICGIILLTIAFLALLLLKGSDEHPATWKLLHAVREKKGQGRHCLPVNVNFYRIGRDGEEKRASFVPQRWYAVGSGEKADFCLDADDNKLAKLHFKICIKGDQLAVVSMERETFVNGVPIQQLGTVQMNSGDLIRAGSHEYRVIFLPEEEKENAT